MEPLIVANTKFSIDLLKELCKVNTGNVLFSPLSISSALGLVLLGAKSNTAEQMYTTLHLNPEKIMYDDLNKELNKGGNNRSLNLVNRMFGEKTIDFKDDFLDNCEEWCLGSLRSVDFKTNPEAAKKRINTWVESKTEDQIKNLLYQGDVSKNTSLALISAVHFKDKWDKPFKKGTGVKASMMYQTNTFPLGNIPEADSRILEIPYENKEMSMLVMLPNKSDGLQKLIDVISYENILEWTLPARNIPTEVAVEMPIFKLKEKYDLKKVLKFLGITDVFDDKCDLSGMAPEPLKLSKVVHKSIVKVNEEGTKADGGSDGVVQALLSKTSPESFKADHSFLFFIRHNSTKTILLCSRFIPPQPVN